MSKDVLIFLFITSYVARELLIWNLILKVYQTFTNRLPIPLFCQQASFKTKELKKTERSEQPEQVQD